MSHHYRQHVIKGYGAPRAIGAGSWPLLSVLAISMAAVVAGCATFHPEPLSPEKTASAFEARTLNEPALTTFLKRALGHEVSPWPPAAWDLSMLTLAAYYSHPDLAVARAGWAVAQAGVKTAGARPNPSVSIAPQHVMGLTDGLSPWVFGPTFDLPIETAGKRGYRIARARYLSEAARLNLAAVAWQVRSRVRARLVDLYAATQEAAILKTQEADEEQYAAFLEERLVTEEVSPSTVTQAQIARDRTLFSLRQADQRVADTRAQLADALGLPAHALSDANISFAFLNEPPPPLSTEDLRHQALLSRADLLGALAEYAASQAALQLEVAKQYPDLHLGPGYSWDQGTEKWSLGISVSLPVLDRNQGPIAEAVARRTEAAARFTALQAKILGDVDRALGGYHAALAAFETAGALSAAQTVQYHVSERMLTTGEVAPPALLGARAELNAAALSRLHALVQLQQSLGGLEDTVQRPLDSAAMDVVPLDPQNADQRRGGR